MVTECLIQGPQNLNEDRHRKIEAAIIVGHDEFLTTEKKQKFC